jgi:F0F1-type ATP synthase assembly protein I
MAPAGRSGLGQSGREYLRFTTVGLQFVITICLSVAFGWWLDVKLETKPWLMLVFALLSPPVAFYHLYRAVYGTEQIGDGEADDEQP